MAERKEKRNIFQRTRDVLLPRGSERWAILKGAGAAGLVYFGGKGLINGLRSETLRNPGDFFLQTLAPFHKLLVGLDVAAAILMFIKVRSDVKKEPRK